MNQLKEIIQRSEISFSKFWSLYFPNQSLEVTQSAYGYLSTISLPSKELVDSIQHLSSGLTLSSAIEHQNKFDYQSDFEQRLKRVVNNLKNHIVNIDAQLELLDRLVESPVNHEIIEIFENNRANLIDNLSENAVTLCRVLNEIKDKSNNRTDNLFFWWKTGGMNEDQSNNLKEFLYQIVSSINGDFRYSNLKPHDIASKHFDKLSNLQFSRFTGLTSDERDFLNTLASSDLPLQFFISDIEMGLTLNLLRINASEARIRLEEHRKEVKNAFAGATTDSFSKKLSGFLWDHFESAKGFWGNIGIRILPPSIWAFSFIGIALAVYQSIGTRSIVTPYFWIIPLLGAAVFFLAYSIYKTRIHQSSGSFRKKLEAFRIDVGSKIELYGNSKTNSIASIDESDLSSWGKISRSLIWRLTLPTLFLLGSVLLAYKVHLEYSHPSHSKIARLTVTMGNHCRTIVGRLMWPGPLYTIIRPSSGNVQLLNSSVVSAISMFDSKTIIPANDCGSHHPDQQHTAEKIIVNPWMDFRQFIVNRSAIVIPFLDTKISCTPDNFANNEATKILPEYENVFRNLRESLFECAGEAPDLEHMPLVHITGHSSYTQFNCPNNPMVEKYNLTLRGIRRDNAIAALKGADPAEFTRRVRIVPSVGEIHAEKNIVKRPIFSNIENEKLSRHVEIEILYAGKCHI